MRSCHNLSAGFDDPNLVSCAGLIPVMTLAERAGLHDLARAHVRVPGAAGSNADVKVAALVAGMVAGADTIDAMDLLRHGGMGRVSTAGRAPSTLGTFLRSFTFGHVRQLDAVASRVLVNLAARAPLLAGADQVAFVDIDDTIKATYGYAKQGAGYGYSGVKGLNALLATVSSPLAAPVIVATRLRKGSTNSARGAPPGRRSVLHHRPQQPGRQHGDRQHPRRCLDADPLPQRGLGRGRATPDQRRRDRRGAVHRVHLPAHRRPHQRPADGAPRETPEPDRQDCHVGCRR